MASALPVRSFDALPPTTTGATVAEEGSWRAITTPLAAQAESGATAVDLADTCARLSGLCLSPGAKAAVGAVFSAVPRQGEARRRSALCSDGGPLEIGLRLGDRPRVPTLALDPGLSCTAPQGPLTCLLATAAQAQPSLTPWVTTIAARLHAIDAKPRHAWLGLPIGLTAAAVRLYLDLSGPHGEAAGRSNGSRAREWIDALDLAWPSGDLLERIAALGHPRILGLDLTASGLAGYKLSFALACADRARMAAVAAWCGCAPALLLDYLDRILRRGTGWSDRRCGVALAFGRDDPRTPRALTFYHTLRPYLGDDASIRQAVLALARGFGWVTQPFAALARALQDERGGRAFQLAGFTVTPSGARNLTLYANTGHAIG